MELWHLILYGAASFLALQSLGTLMTNHRRHYRRQLLLEYRRELRRRKGGKKSERRPDAQQPRPGESPPVVEASDAAA